MNVHKNAALTPRGRDQLVERLERGESKAAASAAAGVSRQTARKWEKRMAPEGVEGLQDRSSRPQTSPTQVRRVRERQIKRRREKRWMQAAIADDLGMPLSTVGAVCRRLGLGRLPDLEHRPPIVHCQRDRAGELIHMDIKKLAWIERVGHRIDRDRGRSVHGAGWEFLQVCIDDASRVAYAEVLPDEKGVTCSGFQRRTAAWLEDRGVRVERFMTENGSGHVSKVFKALVRSLGAKLIRTPPHTPRPNGKAQRFIQTCKREWAYARPYPHSRDRSDALDVFLCFYNCHRPHSGIGRKTPQIRLNELVDNVPGC